MAYFSCCFYAKNNDKSPARQQQSATVELHTVCLKWLYTGSHGISTAKREQLKSIAAWLVAGSVASAMWPTACATKLVGRAKKNVSEPSQACFSMSTSAVLLQHMRGRANWLKATAPRAFYRVRSLRHVCILAQHILQTPPAGCGKLKLYKTKINIQKRSTSVRRVLEVTKYHIGAAMKIWENAFGCIQSFVKYFHRAFYN